VSKLVLFNKPFNVLSQFTDDNGRQTLADYIDIKAVYAAGRLDYDSEGLLLLTDDGQIQAQISSPKFKLNKT
jgi:23S rRNA pseudouridine2457 synthase